MTYGDLQTQLRDKLHRGTSFDEQLPAWLNDAKQDVEDLRNWPFLASSSDLTTTASVRYVELPALFKQLRDDDAVGRIVSDIFLRLPRTSRQQAAANYRDTDTGLPAYWEYVERDVDADDVIECALDIWPLPDDAYTIRVYHYAYSAAMSSSGDEPEVCRRWPNLVIALAVVRACEDLQDDAQAAAWRARAEVELGRALRTDKGRAVGQRRSVGLVTGAKGSVRAKSPRFR